MFARLFELEVSFSTFNNMKVSLTNSSKPSLKVDQETLSLQMLIPLSTAQ